MNRRRNHLALIVIGALLVLTTCLPWILFEKVTTIEEERPKSFSTKRFRLAPRNNLNETIRQEGSKSGAKYYAKVRFSNETVYHFIVSSGCSPYQRWQVLTQIYSARAVQQDGRYTWIVSGCPEETKSNDELTPSKLRQDLREDFEDDSLITPEIHFTPDFSNMSVYGGPFADGSRKRTFLNKQGQVVKSFYGNMYHFNNKPNGLRDWAEQRYANGQYMDEAVILIDPDFLFLTRFHLPVKVSPGKPAAAHYGLGGQWLDFNLTAICGMDSPCTRTTQSEIHQHYSAGPPYIVHAADVLKLATRWSELVPPTYDQYPLLYAEMYAYSMAAAHLHLPHKLVNGLFTGCMVSWPGTGGGNAGPSAQAFVTSGANGTNPVLSGAASCFLPPLVPPPLLHYCQRYAYPIPNDTSGSYYFVTKRRIPRDILNCQNPDFLTPFTSEEKISIYNHEWTALAVCAIIRAVNYAKNSRCGSTTKGIG